MGRAEDRTLKVDHNARSFAASERGSITIFAIVAFAMLMVLVGLVIDVGRVMNIHSQASSYADRAALTAAAELDNRSDALNRAINAAQGAQRQLEPGNRFSLGSDSTVGISRIIFMSKLDPDPADPYAATPLPSETGYVTAIWTSGGLTYNNGYNATTAVRASKYVVVETTLEQENFLFFNLASGWVPGLPSNATVAPQAVAGFVRQLCNYPPIFVCNIAETGGVGAAFTPQRGQMIKAKAGGGSGGWGPGNFGLIDAPDGNGASAVREYMARVNPNTTCTNATVQTEPGANTGPVSQGMNVRMDMYDGAMSGNKNSTAYAPAPVVIKGLATQGDGCTKANPDKSANTSPYPRDNCFMPSGAFPAGTPLGGNSSTASSRCLSYNGTVRAGVPVAGGDWDRSAYWTYNHGGSFPTDIPSLAPGAAAGATTATPTRYEMYRYEQTHGVTKPPKDESSAPTCSSAPPVTSTSADRRVLQMAVVNCREAGISGSADLSAAVVGYLDVFLTEPVGNDKWWCIDNPCNQDMYVEVIDYVDASTRNSVLKEYPVLFR